MSRLFYGLKPAGAVTSTRIFKVAQLVSALSILGVHSQLHAQEPLRFDSVTIEGQETVSSTPWATETTREDLDRLQIQNWNDLGKRAEPGIYFNESSQSLSVRGLDKNRVLTRIDGIRQTWLTDVARGVRGGSSTIDFSSLSSIDIVRGADSSSFGAGVLGGLVDVRSIGPSDLLTEGKHFAGLFKTGYRSVDQSWLTNLGLASQLAPGSQLMLQAGLQSGREQSNMGTTDVYGTNRTLPDPDHYLQENYQLKLIQKIDAAHTVGLSGTYFNRQDNIQNRSASTQIYFADSAQLENSSRRESIALDYGWRSVNSNSLIDTIDAKAYWQRVQLSSEYDAFRISMPVGKFVRNNTLSDSTIGFQSSVSKYLPGDINQLWKAGFDWYGNSTEQSSHGRDNCPASFSRYSPCRFLRTNQADMPQVRGSQFGLWVQNKIGNASETLSLTPAIRYDYFQYQPQLSDQSRQYEYAGHHGLHAVSTSGVALSPKLLGEWTVNKNISLFAQYAFGFNAPSPTQLYSRFGSPGTYLISGNPALKPESSRGLELGTKLGDDKLNGALTFFDNRYQNFIEAVQFPGTPLYPYYIQSFENLDQVRIYGLEARGSLKFSKGWRLNGSLAWAVGKNQQTQQSLNSIAPLTAIAALSYSQEQWGIQTHVTLSAARREVTFPESNFQVKYADFQAPGFGVADLSAYWTPAQFTGLRIQAGIYNLFNQTYWNALSVPTAGTIAIPRGLDFYTSPGRNVQLTVNYQF